MSDAEATRIPPHFPRPLLVRLRNWVGDVVLALPTLHRLQSQGYDLHLVARGRWAPALLSGYDWPVSLQPQGLRAKVGQLRHIGQEARKSDAGFRRRENALVFPDSFSSALEMRLAGLRAVGYAHEGRSPLLTRAEAKPPPCHELRRYWHLGGRFLRSDAEPPADIGLRVAADRADQAGALLAAQDVHGPFIVVCPFAGGRAPTKAVVDKRWPSFAAFVDRAAAELGLPVVVYPGPGEEEAAAALYPQARRLVGGDLGTYAAVLQRAALVVSNDTGPGHMAAAVGTPTLSVLGPTPAARWAPWGRQVRVVQRPQGPEGSPPVWPEVDEVLDLARTMAVAR